MINIKKILVILYILCGEKGINGDIELYFNDNFGNCCIYSLKNSEKLYFRNFDKIIINRYYKIYVFKDKPYNAYVYNYKNELLNIYYFKEIGNYGTTIYILNKLDLIIFFDD